MADPIADSKTSVSGSASTADIAAASAQGAAAGAQTGMSQDSRNSYQADLASVSGRVADFVKDTGTDERFQLETADRSSTTWLNSKRTYDLHQTWDADGMHAARGAARRSEAYENRSAEQTLLHQAKINSQEIAERQQDHAQRVRFADSALTVQVALLTDMAEKLGEIHSMCAHIDAKG